MRRSLIVLFLLFVVLFTDSNRAIAALTDSDAMNKAKTIWGPLNAAIGRFRKFGDPTWTYQVGCIDSVTGLFTVVGKASLSWDAAFATVNTNTNGPHVITAIATDAAGNSTTSAPVTVYACNP
jgi:hypothetical protein